MNEQRSLVRKLSEVMAAVERVEKKGYNAHFNYNFVRETDLLAAVRPEFAKRQLLMTMSAQPQEAKQVGNILTVPFDVTIHDGESGETLSFVVLGAGQDTQDKGPYKALTGAVKYALMKLLLVDTGDDPEASASESPPRPKAAAPKAVAPKSDVVKIPSILRGYVTLVTQKKDKGNDPPKWILYRVTLAPTGVVGALMEFTTFSRTLAEAAKDAEEKRTEVVITYQQTEKGKELVTLETASSADAADDLPL